MLAKCPECNLDVSSKAVFCPHCGYPFEPKKITTKISTRRRRLPNGFGQITELKNKNLRKPFRAMVTVGKDEHGRPICKLLKPDSYFKTYNDAYAALANYHRNPDSVKQDITMDEYFKQWRVRQMNLSKSDGAQALIKATWKYCEPLYNMKVPDVRMVHIEQLLEDPSVFYRGKTVHASDNVKVRIKTLLTQMLDTAILDGIADKNYAQYVKIVKKDKPDGPPTDNIDEVNEGKHISFSDKEMDLLWANVDSMEYVDMILINCYLGMRPQELCLIKLINVDLDTWRIVGGLKTASGKHRVIPVHTRIQPYVKRWYDKAQAAGSEYLFFNETANALRPMTYNAYRYKMNQIKKKLGLNNDHKPHDCRVQFITMAKHAGVNEYILKRVTGHKISDITESVYTKRTFDEIRSEIEKIK